MAYQITQIGGRRFSIMEVDRYCDEYQAVYNAMIIKPSSEVAARDNAMVESWVNDGVWATKDVIYVHDVHTNDNGEALINWKNPGVNDATIVLDGGTMNFTPFEGFQSDDGAYIDYGYNPGSEGVNYQQDNGSFGFYSRSDIGEDAYDMGVLDTPGWSVIASRWSDNRMLLRINDLTSLAINGMPDSLGMHIVSRLSSSQKVVFKNSQQLRTHNSTSTAVPDHNTYGLTINNNGAPSSSRTTRQHALQFWGAGMTRDQADNFTEAYETRMAANGKSVITTNDIYVNPDGSQDFTTIAAALASISDNSNLNRYNIYITGTFNEYSLQMKDFVNLIGYGPTMSRIIGYLPADSPEATIQNTSTIDCDNVDFKLENLYVSIQNGRYAIHSDAGAQPGNTIVKDQKFINVTAEHVGNAEADAYWGHEVWATLDALGMGFSDNMRFIVTGGEYITAGTNSTSRGIGMHAVTVAAAKSYAYLTDVICRSGGTYVLRTGMLFENEDEYYFDNVSMYGDLLINGTGAYTDNTTETGSDPIILNGNIISD